jgi:hypothetical protein
LVSFLPSSPVDPQLGENVSSHKSRSSHKSWYSLKIPKTPTPI